MKGLFIPDITVEMFRSASVESVAELMAEGKIYDIDYKKPCEDYISRAAAMAEIQMNSRRYSISKEFGGMGQVEWSDILWSDILISSEDALNILRDLPSAQPKAEQEPKTDINKLKAEIVGTLYVDSLIFGELIDFKNGKISADDVIEEFNRVTKMEISRIIDKYKESEVENG